jgi:hypothetical protein
MVKLFSIKILAQEIDKDKLAELKSRSISKNLSDLSYARSSLNSNSSNLEDGTKNSKILKPIYLCLAEILKVI